MKIIMILILSIVTFSSFAFFATGGHRDGSIYVQPNRGDVQPANAYVEPNRRDNINIYNDNTGSINVDTDPNNQDLNSNTNNNNSDSNF